MKRPPVLAQQRFAEHRDQLTSLSLSDRFRAIHDLNLWGAPTSVSGLGSEHDATQIFARRLAHLCSMLGVETLIDAPCGDGRWVASAGLPIQRYIGIDIVPELIDGLAKQHARDATKEYRLADLTIGPIPRGDLILCRDCLVHLSFENTYKAIAHLVDSGSEWLAVTHFTNADRNEDVEDGDWRPLNHCLEPFSWSEPALLINEDCQEMGGAYQDKCLGIWRIADLPKQV